MAWQDSHFSLSYDRPSTTAVSQPNIAYSSTSQPGNRSYFETLTRIISLVLEVVRGRMLSPHSQMNLKVIQAYKESIQQILAEAKPHLRDREFCLTPTEHLERVVLRLHASYFLSELCRPAIKGTADVNDPVIKTMRGDCIANLMATVETYIEMHTVSSHASRSWITMQRAVSSAFLLAVIEESKMDTRILSLLRHLEAIIAERAESERAFDGADVPPPPHPASSSTTSPTTTTTTATTATTATAATAAGSSVQPIASQGLDATATPSSGISPPTANPVSPSSAAPIAVGPDPQTQWAKPLAKTLRALQKLNSAFNVQGMHRMPSTSGSDIPFNLYSTATTPLASTTAGAGAGAGASPGGASGLGTRVGGPVQPGLSATPGSLPPPTPESSTSGEWTVPNLIDRASEYIHPPLWG